MRDTLDMHAVDVQAPAPRPAPTQAQLDAALGEQRRLRVALTRAEGQIKDVRKALAALREAIMIPGMPVSAVGALRAAERAAGARQ